MGNTTAHRMLRSDGIYYGKWNTNMVEQFSWKEYLINITLAILIVSGFSHFAYHMPIINGICNQIVEIIIVPYLVMNHFKNRETIKKVNLLIDYELSKGETLRKINEGLGNIKKIVNED